MPLKSRSLVSYKMGYDPDTPKKTKSIEVDENGAKRTFAIPVVSGEKEVEFQINEQLTVFLSFNNFSVYWS